MSCRSKLFAFIIGASLCAPAFASLTYSTGQDINADGIDDQFTVNGGAAYLVTQSADGWPSLPSPGTTTGQYISYDADQSNATRVGVPAGDFIYQFQFNWGGAAGSTLFDFRWVSDDYLMDIVLNGVSLGINNLGAPAPWTLSNSSNGVSGDVLAGLNTIQFLIQNTYGGATGLAADFTIAGDATPGNSVPEPASLSLAGLGLALAWSARRRKA